MKIHGDDSPKIFAKFIRKSVISIILFVVVSISLFLITENTSAEPTKLEIHFDYSELEYIIEPNCTYIEYFGGYVSCEFGEIDNEIFRIEVDIWAGDSQEWSPNIGPEHITFYSDGLKRFNVSISIPTDIYNQTEDQVTVSGTWRTEPFSTSHLGGHGTIESDHCIVRVNRTIPISGPKIITPEIEEYRTLWEELNNAQRASIIGIPISIVAVVIIALLYRRKKNKELLEYFMR